MPFLHVHRRMCSDARSHEPHSHQRVRPSTTGLTVKRRLALAALPVCGATDRTGLRRVMIWACFLESNDKHPAHLTPFRKGTALPALNDGVSSGGKGMMTLKR